MSSPLPQALKMKYQESFSTDDHDDEEADTDRLSPTTEQVGEMYKIGYRKFIESFSVQNAKVRYYCNKTLTMRQPLYDILDQLIILQQKVMAYLPQDPRTFDHYVLSMLFTLIGKTTSMINWNKLNQKCFKDDFQRETQKLRVLFGQAQVATFECVHTIVDKANRAMEILQGCVPPSEKGMLDPRLHDTRVQDACDGTFQGIKVLCIEPRETLILQWIDMDHEIQSVKLSQTSDNFRLRFLRSLIFCTRKALELMILTMTRVDITLRTEFPIEKLIKCEGLLESQLLPHEQAALFKSKREFDTIWDAILCTLCRFRMQLESIVPQQKMLKLLMKNQKLVTTLHPRVDSIAVHIEEPLLLSIVSQEIMEEVNNESYNLIMYNDRTKDIVDIIRDLWAVDKISYKNINMLTMLVYSALSHLHDSLNRGEQKELRNNLNDILVQRDKVKRYLKKALAVFNHYAFNDLPIRQTSNSNTASPATSSRTDLSEESDSDSDDDHGTLFWVQLPGGYVTIGEHKEFLVINQFKDRHQFRNMDEEQQVVLTNKMIARLFHFVASEACYSKILLERCLETKSLVKRLKPKDKNDNLVSIISSGNHYIRHMIHLMKTMNMLKIFTKKV